MGKYLRFGDIPKNERSIKWTELTLAQREYLTECVNIYGEDIEDAVDTAIELVKDFRGIEKASLFECGVSVFEIDADGKPILNTKELKSSYDIRVKTHKAIYVTGDLIGRGTDGEPLIVNVKEIIA